MARTCQKWFVKFFLGDFSLKDEPKSGRPSEDSDEVLCCMIRINRTLISTEVNFKLGIHLTTASDYIKTCFSVQALCLGATRIQRGNLMDRISICSSNLARYKREPFLNHLVTGDEKWIVYKHVVRKKEYVYKGMTPPSTPEAGVHQKKAMLCCW
ncbi:histone-lysine N-methyltransferase SETMAR [Trichonephila clavipes]|nr:histone-lysine N-methyltransferase SETMAR [Trichonephila clavipes]